VNDHQRQIAQQLGLLQQTKQKRWVWVALATILLVIAAGTVAFWFSPQTPPPIYKTDIATRMNLAVTVTATGSIEPKDEVEVSSELSGIMAEVFVDYNDTVTQGQPLAKLDTTRLNAVVLEKRSQLISAQASVAQAKAALEEATLNDQHYQQVWQLSQGTHPSQQTLDGARIAKVKAEAAVAVATASVAVAEADLESAQTDLVKATIVSPIDGVVLSKDVEPGQTIAASYSAPTLFVLARDLKEMELHVDVDEADVGKIKVGQRATFNVDAYPGRNFAAQIKQIRLVSADSSEETSSVVSYATVLTVANDDLALLPSMTAVTDIAVQFADNALTVADAALRFTPDNNSSSASNKTSSGGVLASLMPPRGPQRQGPPGADGGEAAQSRPKAASASPQSATLWVLRQDVPTAVEVTTGMTDGARVEIIAGELREGDTVIIDSVQVKKS